MGEILYNFFFKTTRFLLLIAILFLVSVTLFVDNKLAGAPGYLSTIYLLRGIQIALCAALLAFSLINEELFFKHREAIINLNLIVQATIMSLLVALTGGPKNMYFLGIIEFTFATLMICGLRPLWFGLNLAASLLLYLGILYGGAELELYTVDDNAKLASLTSLLICMIVSFYMNRNRFRRDKATLLEAEKLRQVKLSALRLTEQHNQFLLNFNHEIRNPLMEIITAQYAVTTEIEESNLHLSNSGKNHLSTIERSVGVIEKLIVKLINYFKAN